MDTIHNETKFTLKTGPVLVADWSVHNTRSGVIQVPEEKIEFVENRVQDLGLDIPGSTAGTDGGSA